MAEGGWPCLFLSSLQWVQSLLVFRQKGQVRVQRDLHSLRCDREDSLQDARLRDATVRVRLNCQLEQESGSKCKSQRFGLTSSTVKGQ